MNNEYATRIDTASSQGMIAFDDESAVLIHDSTYPPLLHRNEYGPKFSAGVNMDRGGFGKRGDGSRYACLFDGTGGGGLDSLYAAQDFTDEMLTLLRSSSIPLTQESVTKLLTQCSFAKPTTSYGDATCVFVDCVPDLKSGLCHLQGGALGDSGIIHIKREGLEATLFETILKDDRTNISDTGGCIGRYGMIYRPDNISILAHDIALDDFVVLASDGLLDNLYRGEESEVISLIVSSPFFDKEHKDLPSDVPTAAELSEILRPFGTSDTPPTAVQIAKRLNRYIRFITAKKAEAFETLLQEWELVESVTAKEQIGQKFKAAERTLAGKCDDCLLIVLQAG